MARYDGCIILILSCFELIIKQIESFYKLYIVPGQRFHVNVEVIDAQGPTDHAHPKRVRWQSNGMPIFPGAKGVFLILYDVNDDAKQVQ